MAGFLAITAMPVANLPLPATDAFAENARPARTTGGGGDPDDDDGLLLSPD